MISPREIRPEGDVAGYVGETPVQPGRVPPRIAAQQPGLAAVGPEQAEQNPQRGGLAGAVRAEERVHFAGPDSQVKAVERADRTEPLLQPVDLDRVHRNRGVETPDFRPGRKRRSPLSRLSETVRSD
jgi:hypothetical protein